MAWRPIYLDYDSITCKKEKKCIPDIRKQGIDTLREAKAIIKEILKDLKEGKTWDHYGQPRKMDLRLAIRRINYIKPLAIKHGMPKRELKMLDIELEKAREKAKEIWERKRKKRIRF